LSDPNDVAWYIERDGQRFGPFSADEFARFEADKQLVATDYVWCTGLDGWLTYGEFQSRFAPVVAPPRPTNCAICVAIKKLVRVPLDLALTAFEIVARPTAFAQRRIDAGPRDLYRSLYFYFNMFTVAFVIASSLTYLDFYSGSSQLRELTTLALQIAAALPIIYVLNIIVRQNVRLSGLVQAVLYADAVFLVLISIVGRAFAYLSFDQTINKGELDVIATELEKCLSTYSFAYWLIRGELQFFHHMPAEATNLATLQGYVGLAMVVMLCLVFAKLMKGRYATSLWLNVIFAVLAYYAVVSGTTYALEKAHRTITANAPCTETAARRAYATYNQAIVVKQIADRINQGLRNALKSSVPWVTAGASGLVMDLQLKPLDPPYDQAGAVSSMSLGALRLYCENNTDFRFARAIQVPLQLVVRDQVGNIIHSEEISPTTCAVGR
jgi:GYF domain 2